MSYRTIYITDETSLSLSQNRIKIKKEDIEAEIPIEDINSVIIDGYRINISLNLLNTLSKFNSCLDYCYSEIDLPKMGMI